MGREVMLKRMDAYIRSVLEYFDTQYPGLIYAVDHSAPAGLKFGRFAGEDEHTTPDSDRLVRLPMYYNLAEEDIQKVIDKTLEFFVQRDGGK